MASIITGYEYDIFISYRQKDNKYDGWVTEFVDNLKKELEATFKEEISVYFDINPHDGLLATHDVGDSLKEKLKCLVFIPVISRTYCDPNSFAWEHEFKAFIEQASKDQYGLKVKLPGGNVANRVLPIRIYDLNNADVKLCETVLGGILRSVEFTYSEPGVNRPLKPDDDEKINLNKTKYRNQINKVGNAIQDIISGLKIEPLEQDKEKIKHREPLGEVSIKDRTGIQEKPAKTSKRKLLLGVEILSILIIAGVFAYPKIFKKNALEKLRLPGERMSVAVMPFQNMTNDTIWNIWQEGIQDILINSLSNSEELKVRQKESISTLIQIKGLTNYASITPSVASNISQKLEAAYFINGSIKHAGTILRINAQIINSKTEEILKSFQIEEPFEEKMIFQTIDSLSSEIKNFLIISELKKDLSFNQHSAYNSEELVTTYSPEAYRFFLLGRNAFRNHDYSEAIKLFIQAIKIDSNYIDPQMSIPFAFSNQGIYDQGKGWCLKLYAKKDHMTMKQKLFLNYIYADFFETPYESIKYLSQSKELDDQDPNIYYGLGVENYRVNQYDKAIIELEKSIDIYNKWNSKPLMVDNYILLGSAYHQMGQYKQERKLYRKAEHDFPDNPSLIYNQAILALAERDTVTAKKYIEKFMSFIKDNPEAEINAALASIYDNAKILDKAEEYYREALSSEPENPQQMNYLGYFLIDKDRNINEGLELIERALKLQPDNCSYLDSKGWGLFKQGKYPEALEFIQRSWKTQPYYNHEVYLHLTAAKKSVASQKKN
jgi:tetratricopeptide (TPR) repeat protein